MNESEQPADPGVLRRRKHQEAAARWLAKWSYPLQAFFAATGLIVVLLPMLLKSWRSTIEDTPIAAHIFRDFSTFSGLAIVLLATLMLIFMILNWTVDNYPGNRNPTKQFGFPTPSQIVEMALYPQTKREKFVFWCDILFGILMTTWWGLAFSLIAFFIGMRH